MQALSILHPTHNDYSRLPLRKTYHYVDWVLHLVFLHAVSAFGDRNTESSILTMLFAEINAPLLQFHA